MRLLTISLILLFSVLSVPAKSQVTGQKNIGYASAPVSLQSSIFTKGFGQSYLQTSCEYLTGGSETGNSFITKYDSFHNVIGSIKLGNYFIRGICEDAANNFYTIGIDAGTLPTVSLLKISQAGNIIWKRTIPQTNYSNIFVPDYYPYDFYKAVFLSNGNILFNCFSNNSRALLLLSSAGTLLRSVDVPVIIGDIEQGFNNTLTATYFDKTGFFGENVTASGVIQFDYDLRIIRNKKISTPSSFFIYGVSAGKDGSYYLNGVDSSYNSSSTAGGILIKLDSQLNTIPNNTTAFVNTSKKNCSQTNDGRYFKITVNDNSIAVIENLFFVSLQNSIVYNNNKYVSVPILNFDNALNLKWSKNVLIRQDSLNPVFMISDDIVEVKDNFIFSLRSNLDKVFLYYTDTAGNTGNCYNTTANYAVRKITTTFTDTSFTISPSLFTIQPPTLLTGSSFESTVITLECVPPLKPVSNFVTNYTSGVSDTSIVCLDAAVSFIDSSKNDPSIFYWVFPPQADLSNADSTCFPNIGNVFFLNEGVFPVKLIACNNFGCDTITKFIQVSIPPISPNLGDDTSICQGDSIAIIYTDTLNGMHEFTGSNGMISSQDTIFIKESGTYRCTVAAACGVASDEITVTVLQKPVAAFTHKIFCDSLKVSFIGTSQTDENAVPEYHWSFFSPANILIGHSAIEDPFFAFPSFDSFKVTLSVSSSHGCTAADSITKFSFLKAKPVVAFSATNVCGSLTASFNNNSTVAADSLQSYYWDFGNGQTSNEKNPRFTFSSYGSKTVKLAVVSSRGCTSDTIPETVLIKNKPTPSLAYDNACENRLFTITAVASDNIINHQWWVNDTVQINNSNRLTLIKPAGNYLIKYLAVSDKGCASDPVLRNIVLNAAPLVNASIENGCVGIPVNFSSQLLAGNAATQQWYFGNGDSSVAGAGNYSYSQAGNFTARYFATDTNGCQGNTVLLPVNIESLPLAVFSRGDACLGKPMRFSAAASSNAFGAITNYNWLFNDTQTATGISVSFPFSTPGTSKAVLTVNTANGCTAEKTMIFEVGNTAVSAGADTVILQNTAYTLQGSGAVSYQWQPAALLDNSSSANPVTVLKKDQQFTLIATDANGCTGYDSVLIRVIANIFIPNAFSPSGINKVWRIKQLTDYKHVKLSVYNRFGQKVFEGSAANDYTWDGTFKNKLQASGAYVYLLQTDDGKRVRNFKGTVMLIR